MRRSDDIRHGARAVAALLLVMPFVVAQLFAPGTMPVAGAHGPVIQLCTHNGGLVSVVIDGNGVPHPVGDPSDGGQTAPCPWAAAVLALAAQATPAVPAPSDAAWAADPAAPDRAMPRAVALGVPPARAPPAAV